MSLKYGPSRDNNFGLELVLGFIVFEACFFCFVSTLRLYLAGPCLFELGLVGSMFVALLESPSSKFANIAK